MSFAFIDTINMSFSVGIIGLPNVGKSTLFRALTRQQVDISNYPFCTIEPNVGIVKVPDERLRKIAQIVEPEKITPTVIKFVDIAGLVKNAHQGEGLGNEFLARIRQVDAILEVVRLFEDSNIAHTEKTIDPRRDMEIINTELALKDLETVEKRMEKVKKETRSGEKKAVEELEILEQIKERINQQPSEMSLRGVTLSEAKGSDEAISKELQLLTAKPRVYVLNKDKTSSPTVIARSPALNHRVQGGATKQSQGAILPTDEIASSSPRPFLQKDGTPPRNDKKRPSDVFLPINCLLLAEMAELTPEEIKELDLDSSPLDNLIKACYNVLDLITFYTVAGGKEVRAWTIKKGTKAPQAGGKVHTDFEKGFIRAEVIGWEDLVKAGSWNTAREKGWIRTEGKDYEVRNGDVIEFKV